MSAQPPIEDYALIGDGESAALVSRGGSIDWLCWPQFDSPSVFAALLDDDAGAWSLAPAGDAHATRRYVGPTNVLETTFETATGALVVTDFMPVTAASDGLLQPAHELVRIAACVRGRVTLESRWAPRPGYAARRVRVVDAGPLGVRSETRGGLLTLRTSHPGRCEGAAHVATVTLGAGERFEASLTFAVQEPGVLPPVGARTDRVLAQTLASWRAWADGFSYDGPERALVLRSALALKLLIHGHSGAVVAAPTTSLPERVGGDLNWDYRYCWLRDASLTMRALVGLGFRDEADTFLSWLIHSTRLSRAPLRAVYDVWGNAPAPEFELPFRGYRGSSPVRVGNAAVDQLQLDVYGEVIDAAYQFLAPGRRFDDATQRMLLRFGDYVCAHWAEPDEGIWEPRGPRVRHTHSLLLCWTALDRMLQLHARRELRLPRPEAYGRARDAIRRLVEEACWNAELGSYVARTGGRDLDASVLLLGWYGFHGADDPRLRATYQAVRRGLGADGLLYRYRNELSPGEGAFGICSFWGAEYLALGGGSEAQACEAFRAICARANDVGLFAEEIDPATGAQLGNFPQAFTHVGLINAALTLRDRLAGGASEGAG